MDLIKISSDKEKVKSLIGIANLIEERLKLQDSQKMSSLIIVDYYEIIKELVTAILLLDGYKTLSHRDLIEYIGKNVSELNQEEISIIDDLRILRNRVSYEGFSIDLDYLIRNEDNFKKIITKLKEIVTGRV